MVSVGRPKTLHCSVLCLTEKIDTGHWPSSGDQNISFNSGQAPPSDITNTELSGSGTVENMAF